ncbi:M66 family metalloprotease [Acinetobacter calcoaceticus]|uniref:M66 family metalloprotease n=1 Tax=Acinetobacter calcoaceticus TaxID=471 RepID=UPI00192AB415|nr:M66 family metalloprotease [Acinetobacter calcoaceticus]
MQLRLKTLTVCLLPLLLTACGGGDGGQSDAGSKTEKEAYPEPIGYYVDEETLGFYDYDKTGQPRSIRNDLNGSFSAMIQFGQSHVVNPKDNEKDHMPRLTTEKEALLLVTPTLEMGEVTELKAEIYQGTQLLRTIDLLEPSQIPASDQSNSDGRPIVQYSKRTWNAALKWDEVQPGLKIKIVDSANSRQGELFDKDIDFAAPGELVLYTMRLGVLTNAPVSSDHYMLEQPAKAGTDYFQTIPAARMLVVKYDDMKLDKVMMRDGVIYDAASAKEGDVYNGDLLNDIGRSNFSFGIHLANVGVTSASLESWEHSELTQSVMAHHVQGRYSNGDIIHGLIGTEGVVTLQSSVGNEFSHEIGHHYDLDDLDGEDEENNNRFWGSHHADSGWGYIAYRGKMRGNLNWKSTEFSDGSDGVPNFFDIYPYAWNAMSGGRGSSGISKYTHYTGHSTQTKIQPAYDRFVWDARSPTGYKKWNATTREMEVSQPKIPYSEKVWYNSADGNFLKPRMFGVPVYTIVGSYDPDAQTGLVYPAARGNWGNVFDLPQVDPTATPASCWLDVQFKSATQHIALAPQRVRSISVNKFHVNLAQRDKPEKVDLYCKKNSQAAVLLSSITIPSSTTPLAPYVEIGKAVGYSALKTIELPQLNQALIENKGKAVVRLSQEMVLMVDSYKNDKEQLSPDAQYELERYLEQQNQLYRLERWMNAYRADLVAEKPEAVAAFKAFVETIGLKENFNFPLETTLLSGTNHGETACLKVETLDGGKPNAFITGESACVADNSELWIYDIWGRIHSKQYMGQCLTIIESNINLMPCGPNSEKQQWSAEAAEQRIRQTSTNQCFDLENAELVNNRANLNRYGCVGGNNQKWTTPSVSDNLILTGLSDKNLTLAVNVFSKNN